MNVWRLVCCALIAAVAARLVLHVIFRSQLCYQRGEAMPWRLVIMWIIALILLIAPVVVFVSVLMQGSHR